MALSETVYDRVQASKIRSRVKGKAVSFALNARLSQTQVCEELGVCQSLLSRWVLEHRATREQGGDSEELTRLRRENAWLKQECVFRHKAASYFAQAIKPKYQVISDATDSVSIMHRCELLQVSRAATAEDLPLRQFHAGRPYHKWVSGTSEFSTLDAKLYLSQVRGPTTDGPWTVNRLPEGRVTPSASRGTPVGSVSCLCVSSLGHCALSTTCGNFRRLVWREIGRPHSAKLVLDRVEQPGRSTSLAS